MGRFYQFLQLNLAIPAGSKLVRHSFDHPPLLARDAAGEDEALSDCRRVRGEIRDYLLRLPRGPMDARLCGPLRAVSPAQIGLD